MRTRHARHRDRGASARGAGTLRRGKRRHGAERIARLEEYQRELEQEAADVAATIKRLRARAAE